MLTFTWLYVILKPLYKIAISYATTALAQVNPVPEPLPVSRYNALDRVRCLPLRCRARGCGQRKRALNLLGDADGNQRFVRQTADPVDQLRLVYRVRLFC